MSAASTPPVRDPDTSRTCGASNRTRQPESKGSQLVWASVRHLKTRSFMHTTKTTLAALALLVSACATDDDDNATTQAAETDQGSTDDSSATGPQAMTTSVRFAHMSVEQAAVILCVDGEPATPLLGTPIAYPQVTAYLSVAANATLAVAPEDADCDATPLLELELDHGADELSTVVMFGDPGSASRPLELRALLDESDLPPSTPSLTRVRNFHTDTDVGNIDVGLVPTAGTQVFIFEDVGYGSVAQSSSLGEVTERGYVDGIPSMPPAERLNVWLHGTTDVLGWFATSTIAFAPGGTYTVFPAGRALVGTPEAVVCVDRPDPATDQELFSECDVFIPNPPDA